MMLFEVFKDKAGEWRWTLVAQNGNKVGTSGEGYTNKADCLSIIESIKKNASNAAVVVNE
ncbi:MAG TPA: DUF1508 domain-containing protein [Candidatus Fermentibacter daniensis]|nr:DUF1508 domain-containing protein [Candidatus Fermentibacter daniensis]HOR06546.1 DUF1508 domain-containing protein [Candidatus Fermentibacter daniensis]HPK50775.1 DUF1508 domain-containing protein [Candidatus Fermentibacter daniensis]HQE57172.1 DUF1508 domain-containing protein [Candidatus Fermentibacter daniensis]